VRDERVRRIHIKDSETFQGCNLSHTEAMTMGRGSQIRTKKDRATENRCHAGVDDDHSSREMD